MTGPLVVVGDALLDLDVVGRAGRLMPEAPVPVLDELQERARPGGAALAAVLSAAEDHEVVLVTALSRDAAAERLRTLCDEAGVTVVALEHDGSTPVKRRILAGGQAVARLDEGGCGAIGALPDRVLEVLRSASGVLVADYGHGVTAHPQLRSALTALTALTALPRRVPVVWDPHPRGSAPVPGVRLATPNRDEAERLASHVATAPGLGRLAHQAAELVERWQAEAVAITLGADGALVSRGESAPAVVPAPAVTATDTCGAGDRFAASATIALARGALTSEAVQEAVLAASAFVAAGGAGAFGHRRETGAAGTGRVAQVRAAGGTVVATGGCFDLLHAGHVATLEAARSLGDCLVVLLNSDASVSRLKGPDRPLVPAVDRARVLAALACVDEVVVFEEDTPHLALDRLRPDVWVKGGDYAGADLPEAALLAEWGGQAVVVPYLDGRSTTSLVATARAGTSR